MAKPPTHTAVPTRGRTHRPWLCCSQPDPRKSNICVQALKPQTLLILFTWDLGNHFLLLHCRKPHKEKASDRRRSLSRQHHHVQSTLRKGRWREQRCFPPPPQLHSTLIEILHSLWLSMALGHILDPGQKCPACFAALLARLGQHGRTSASSSASCDLQYLPLPGGRRDAPSLAFSDGWKRGQARR